MAEMPVPDQAREVFAVLTGDLEDAVLIACDGQAASTIDEARDFRDRLVVALKAMQDRLSQLEEPLA